MRRAEEPERKRDLTSRRPSDAGDANKKRNVAQELTEHGKEKLVQFLFTEQGERVPDEYVSVLAATHNLLNEDSEEEGTQMLLPGTSDTDEGMWCVV